MRRLFSTMLLMLFAACGSLWAQQDVTSTYLTNADFSQGTAATGHVYGYAKDGSPSGPQTITGWTRVTTGDAKAAAIFTYGSSYQLKGNSKSAPSSGPATGGSGTRCLGLFAVWTGEVQYTQTVTLPAGDYTINIPVYNQSGTNVNTSYMGFIPNSGTSYTVAANPATGAWRNLSVTFTLTASTTGTISLGYKSNNVGSGSSPHLFIDRVQIIWTDPALAPAKRNLDGMVKKAEALNTVLANGTLASLITTIKAKTYTTVADVEADAAALEAYFPSETVAVTNGTFDTDVNINAGGTNSATFIAPATAEKPYIYPVTGWTPNFTFNSTASQGNTAVYGATVTGDNGTNGTNPPAYDMFHKNLGGTLHLSSGWSDIARYYQPLPQLLAGDYILYYEANNQNTLANTINGNYTGVGNLTAGNLLGTNDTFVFSTLKTYPYNQWTASATGFTLTKPQEAGANLNVGIQGTTSGSANGAKLWIDNVTLYWRGWTVPDISALLAQQMNEEVRATLVARHTAAVTANSARPIVPATLAAAQTNLAEAIEAAQASIAVYEKIHSYLTHLGTAGQLGDIPVASFEADEVYTKYSDGSLPNTGTYTALSEVIPLYKTFVAGYWTTNAPAEDDDLTAFIVNQGFELDQASVNSAAGWRLPSNGSDFGTRPIGSSGSTYYMSPAEGSYLFNNWQSWWMTCQVAQDIAGLPNGIYTLSAIVAGYDGSTTTIIANNADRADQVTTGAANGIRLELEASVLDGTMTILAQSVGTSGNTFLKVDDFHLTYKGTGVTDGTINALTLPTGQMAATAKQAMLDAKATALSTHTLDDYHALEAAIAAANASVATYTSIQTFITRLNENARQKGDYTGDLTTTTVTSRLSDGMVNGAADPTTGTYDTMDDFLAEYNAVIADYWAGNVYGGANLTAFIVNQGFELDQAHAESPTGWTVPYNDLITVPEKGSYPIGAEGSTYYMTPNEGSYLYNWYGSPENEHTTWEAHSVSQRLANLPKGRYTLTAIVAGWDHETIKKHSIQLKAGDDGQVQQKIYWGQGAGVGIPAEITLDHADETTAFLVMAESWSEPVDGHNTGFFKADDFQLTFLGIEPMVSEMLTKVNALYAEAVNVDLADEGTPFKIKRTTYDGLKSAIDAAQSIYTANRAEDTHAKYQNLLSAYNTLEAALTDYENAELNPPAAGQLYAIRCNAGGVDWSGKFLTVKGAKSAVDSGSANPVALRFSDEAGSVYPQGLTFTKDPSVPNGFKLSYTRGDGTQMYLCTGTALGTGVAWSDAQIRSTTVGGDALTFRVVPQTTADGTWYLRNTVTNTYIGQTDDAFYTGNVNFDLSIVEATPVAVPFSVNSLYKFSTLMLPFDMECPEGVEAYTVDDIEGNTIYLAEAKVGSKFVFKANVPYIVYAPGGYSGDALTGYGAAYTDETITSESLTGTCTTDRTVTIPAGMYVLSHKEYPVAGGKEDRVGFYRVQAGSTVTLPRNRAYFDVSSVGSSAPVKEAYFFGPDDDETGLSNLISGQNEVEGIYDLKGMRLPRMQKGVNIIRFSDGSARRVMVR
ncbi:MAG: hypothetical protein IJV08_06110 [Bacteroidaceae bacterium]|nr:hypothetical protein [Bacteroidaceae bacterium]